MNFLENFKSSYLVHIKSRVAAHARPEDWLAQMRCSSLEPQQPRK